MTEIDLWLILERINKRLSLTKILIIEGKKQMQFAII